MITSVNSLKITFVLTAWQPNLKLWKTNIKGHYNYNIRPVLVLYLREMLKIRAEQKQAQCLHACIGLQVTKQYRTLNTAISVTCSFLIPFVDELTWECRGWKPTARLVICISKVWRIVLWGGVGGKTAANFFHSFSSWHDRSHAASELLLLQNTYTRYYYYKFVQQC